VHTEQFFLSFFGFSIVLVNIAKEDLQFVEGEVFRSVEIGSLPAEEALLIAVPVGGI